MQRSRSQTGESSFSGICDEYDERNQRHDWVLDVDPRFSLSLSRPFIALYICSGIESGDTVHMVERPSRAEATQDAQQVQPGATRRPDGRMFQTLSDLFFQPSAPSPAPHPIAVLPQIISSLSDQIRRTASSPLHVTHPSQEGTSAALPQTAPAQSASPEAAPTEGPVHQFVGCDGCDLTPVRGPRYKSVHRPDFDLCGACFNSGRCAFRPTLARRVIPPPSAPSVFLCPTLSHASHGPSTSTGTPHPAPSSASIRPLYQASTPGAGRRRVGCHTRA